MKRFLLGCAVGLAVSIQSSIAFAQDSLSIGYFAEWPLPAHYGQQSGAYDEVLGAPAKWTAYTSSDDMFSALHTGEIQIALSQGFVPFLLVATDGFDFRAVDIAVSYDSNENCVARPDLGFSSANPTAINGKSVALALGTLAHFNLYKSLTSLGVDPDAVDLVNLPPAQAAAALKQGKVDVACGWGPALKQMLEYGTALLTSEDRLETGVRNYDMIVIRNSFGADNPEVVAKFLKVTNELNAAYTAVPARIAPQIARSINMTEAEVASSMSGFTFSPINEKLSEVWLGGGVQNDLTQAAGFFANLGTIPRALGDYTHAVDANYLQSAVDLPLIESE